MNKIKHKGEGHRSRLRYRFLQSGLQGFLDYEIIELLLTLGTPRKDCKQMAKGLIKKFGGLRRTLDATFEDLQSIKGIGPSNAFGIKLFQAIAEKYAAIKVPKKIDVNSPGEVVKYLRERLCRKDKENFIALALDTSNKLLKISEVSIGIVDASLVHPREVFKEAIKESAVSVIFAHNHPSDNETPSQADLEITKQLISAGRILDINVLDHVIVTKSSYYSFVSKLPELFIDNGRN